MSFPHKEKNVRKMMRELEATCWRLRECTRTRELAAAHRLRQIRRLRMLEEQKTWKREASFDSIEITVKTDAQRFRTDLNSKPFYSKLYNPRWPYTPEEHTIEMNVEIELLLFFSFFITLIADGPHHILISSRFTLCYFYRDASLAILQLVSQ